MTSFFLLYSSQLQFCIITCTSAAPSSSEIRDCTRIVPGCGTLLLGPGYDPGKTAQNTETTDSAGQRCQIGLRSVMDSTPTDRRKRNNCTSTSAGTVKKLKDSSTEHLVLKMEHLTTGLFRSVMNCA